MTNVPLTSPAYPSEARAPYRRYTLHQAIEKLLETPGHPPQIDVDDHIAVPVQSPPVHMHLSIDRLTGAQRRRFCMALEHVLPGADVVDEDRLARVASNLITSVRQHSIGRIPEHVQRLLGISAQANSHDVLCALSGSPDPHERRMRLIAVQEAIVRMRPPAFSDWGGNGKREKTA